VTPEGPSAVEAIDVSKRFFLRHNRAGSLKERLLGVVVHRLRERLEEFWALHRVSMTIRRGESVGLIGRNGSGKSTLLKLISGIYLPTTGRLLIRRGLRIGSMIELGTGFNPELSGRENVFLNASILGLTRAEIEGTYAQVVEFAELGQFTDQPLKNYSSGMAMRLAFAVAAHLDPDLLLLDEIFAVGDADFQRKCIRKMEDFRRRGTTILMVSHAAETIRANCDRVCLLDHGRLLYDGGVDAGLAEYQRLLAS
jgi:ABC-type polysaccharide/polyol phosphate transport system ATPase subunit